MDNPVLLVNILQRVVAAMQVPDISVPQSPTPQYFAINYDAGRSLQLIAELNKADNSITSKGIKYPFIALLMPNRIPRGESNGFYGVAKIPRIIIAYPTKSGEPSEPVLPKYNGGNFDTILYPLYYEFLRQLAASPEIIGNDPNSFKETAVEYPCQSPITKGTTDYVDILEIQNLELLLNQIKTC